MMRAVESVALMLCVILACGLSYSQQAEAADEGLFSTDGYRIARYRAALPEDPPVGQRIETDALLRLIDQRAPVLIDVQAITVRPETAEFGLSWLPNKTRYNLPGSTWLPNVGYGRLEPDMLAYFETNLARLTGGERGRALVFYCVIDCWMSWNAVKRAHALGYDNLYWYPDGTDGWSEAGLTLQVAQPWPLQSPNAAACDDDHGGAFFVCGLDGLPAALSHARGGDGPRGVLLFFEAPDCPFCERMRRGLLRQPAVIDHYRQRFVVVSLDLSSDAAFIERDGRQTTQARYARDVIGVFRTPTLVFLNSDGDEVFRHAGVVVDPRVFLGLADYVSGGHFERVGLREFLARSAPGSR